MSPSRRAWIEIELADNLNGKSNSVALPTEGVD